LPRHHGTRDFIRPLLLWTGEMDHVRIASACEFTHGHHLLEAHHHSSFGGASQSGALVTSVSSAII
jgi:hypothetical protein